MARPMVILDSCILIEIQRGNQTIINKIYEFDLEDKEMITRKFIHSLEDMRGKTFNDEFHRINDILNSITDTKSLQKGLYDIIGAYYDGIVNSEKLAFINKFIYIILDFIDIFFVYNDNNIINSGFKELSEDDIKKSISKNNEFKLRGYNENLRQILNLSIKRRYHPSVINKKHVNTLTVYEENHDGDINSYKDFHENNFLFLSIFNYFFPVDLSKVKRKNELLNVLNMFGVNK